MNVEHLHETPSIKPTDDMTQTELLIYVCRLIDDRRRAELLQAAHAGSNEACLQFVHGAHVAGAIHEDVMRIASERLRESTP